MSVRALTITVSQSHSTETGLPRFTELCALHAWGEDKMAAPCKSFVFQQFRYFSHSKYSYIKAVIRMNNNLNSFASRRCYHTANVQLQDQTKHNPEESAGGEEQESPDEQFGYDDLYPGHIPTTLFQKALLSVGSAAMSLYNPARDDMISTLGETTGYFALKNIREKMQQEPVGRQILQEQPVINTQTVDISYLGSLPSGTFGNEYWKFLNNNGFSPDARKPVNFVDDPELKYVMLRYRQVHDLFHTLMGMPPNMLGEVAVKWVEAVQTGLPMCVLGAFFGPLRLGPKDTQKYVNIYLPWAIRCGWNARFLMAVYFEKHWETDLSQLREELNVEPSPVPLRRKKKVDTP